MERLELKANLQVDAAGLITGLAAVFATADLGGDILHKGAFGGARGPLPMLASHEPADVVGVWDELVETEDGLKVTGRLLVDEVKRAAEVRALILAKAMTGLSIGYLATKKQARQGGGRDLFKVELYEVSVVAVPMHPGARIEAVKGARPGKVETMSEKTKDDDKEAETKAAAEIETKAADMVTALFAPVVKRLDGIEAKLNRPAGGAGGEGEVTLERKAFRNMLTLPMGVHLPEMDRKALMVSSDPQGGYLTPPEYSAEILKDITELSEVRKYASVRSTSAPSQIYGVRQRFGNAVWDDEMDAETESMGSPYKGVLEVPVWGMSTQVLISNTLMQDAPQVEQDVKETISEDFAIKEATGFVNGTGIGQPEGFMKRVGLAETVTGNAAALTGDGFIRLLYAMPATYRNAGAWIMNGATLGAASLLKDGQGNALWRDSWRDGQPPSILGRPVIEMPDMPDVAPGAYPIMYADLSGYRILDRLQVSMLTDPYSRATQKQTVIHAGRRVGGRIIMDAKFRKMKVSV